MFLIGSALVVMATTRDEGHQKVSSSISEDGVKGQGRDEVNVTKPFPPIASENIRELGHRNAKFGFDLFEYLQSNHVTQTNAKTSCFHPSVFPCYFLSSTWDQLVTPKVN